MTKYFSFLTFWLLNASIPQDHLDLRYNEFLVAMTHNSTSIRPHINTFEPLMKLVEKTSLSTKRKDKIRTILETASAVYSGNAVGDQNYDIQRQLRDGISGFKVPLHLDDQSNIMICHSLSKSQMAELIENIKQNIKFIPDSPLKNKLLNLGETLKKNTCLIDKSNKSLMSFLKDINKFLEANKDEIITINFDTFAINTNDNKNKLKKILVESGIFHKIYYSENLIWPTLKEMVKQNKRIVIFTSSSDWKNIKIYNKNEIGMGTKYEYKTVQDLEYDTNHPSISWGQENLYKPTPILLIDNYTTPLLSGSENDAKIANNFNNLEKRVKAYRDYTGTAPTILMVDFYQLPNNDVIKFVNYWNNNKLAFGNN